MHYKTLYKGRWVTAANAPRLNDKTLRHIVGVPNHVRAWRRCVPVRRGALVGFFAGGGVYACAVSCARACRVHVRALARALLLTHTATRTTHHTVTRVVAPIAPHHREAYLALGGHTRGLPVADDYDLVLRSLFRFPAVYVRHMTYIQVGDV
jgi:hypothetical protein